MQIAQRIGFHRFHRVFAIWCIILLNGCFAGPDVFWVAEIADEDTLAAWYDTTDWFAEATYMDSLNDIETSMTLRYLLGDSADGSVAAFSAADGPEGAYWAMGSGFGRYLGLTSGPSYGTDLQRCLYVQPDGLTATVILVEFENGTIWYPIETRTVAIYAEQVPIETDVTDTYMLLRFRAVWQPMIYCDDDRETICNEETRVPLMREYVIQVRIAPQADDAADIVTEARAKFGTIIDLMLDQAP